MSARWLKKLILAAALAAMPLQGVAAGMAVLLCHGDAQAHATHDSGDHDHGPKQDGHHDDSSGTGVGSYHLCCHYTVSAPSVFTAAAVLPEFHVRTFAPDSLHDLFVPDQPQRPPLA
jgi:hypothetical protein